MESRVAGWRERGAADETLTYGRRVRDLEAAAFRTARTLAVHGDRLATVRGQLRTASETTGFPGNAMGVAGERTVAERLDVIERVLFALARAQGIDPGTVG